MTQIYSPLNKQSTIRHINKYEPEPARVFMRAFRKNRFALIAILLLVLISIAALFAPYLTSHDPTLIRLEREFTQLAPSSEFLLGTDHLGRDVWSRLLFGARISLLVGFLTMLISISVGSIYGAVSGYYGGWLDSVLMRVIDILLSLPTIFLLIILAHLMKPGYLGIALIIGLTSWMRVARLVRGQFLNLKEQEYVEAARSLGFSHARIILFHILPNTSAPLIINATLLIAQAILIESALSFLGLGVGPPQFSWGSMLYAAQDIILLQEAPWIAFAPGISIFITVLCINFVGDGLRDALDPKLKNVGG